VSADDGHGQDRARVIEAGHQDKVIDLLTMAAKTRPGKPWETVILPMVNSLCTEGGVEPIANPNAPKIPTVEDFSKDWTSGTLHTKHPDHVGKKDSTRDAEVFRLYVNPHIGHELITDVAVGHLELVMSSLPSHLSPRTRKLVAQAVRRLLSLAVYPGRHLKTNPIPREWMPKVPKSANKAKTLLYPADDAKLMACISIPIERRFAYGILIREGMRASELAGLHWRDLDLEHGRIRLDRNKTSDRRAWALSPDVARTLAWWKEQTGGEDSDLVLMLDLKHAVHWLRGAEAWKAGDPPSQAGDLRTAGITRAELFERTDQRQPLRCHDLRASFVTLSLAGGRTEQWVRDRTGHQSSAMLALYTRQRQRDE
jgi:integrase